MLNKQLEKVDSLEKLALEIMISAIVKVERLGFRMKVCELDNRSPKQRRLDLKAGRIVFYHPLKH